MSKLIQKILDIGGCDAETEWGQGYDDGVNAAVNVVEEYFEQSTLNQNQEVVFDWLKERYKKYNERPSTIIYFLSIHYSFAFEDHGKAKRAFGALNSAQELQVLQVFSDWALEQEDK